MLWANLDSESGAAGVLQAGAVVTAARSGKARNYAIPAVLPKDAPKDTR